MLTPLDFKFNFQQAVPDYAENDYYRNYLAGVTEQDQFTQQQWDNLVKVCSVIDANQDRFYMANWHNGTVNECGTSHCIAGWAISLEKNDTNTTTLAVEDIIKKYNFQSHDPNLYGITAAAAAMMSTYVVPFFFIIFGRNCGKEDYISAEELMMKYLIRPVLDEAKRESYQLSQEVQEFINTVKRETCHVN
jgi:hypothetical protein